MIYKDSLIGDILGPYTQAFSFNRAVEIEDESDSELEHLTAGMAEVKLSKERKARIRAPWSKALIVKVYNTTIELWVTTISFSKSILYGTQWPRWTTLTKGNIFFLIKFSDEGFVWRSLVY